MDSPPPSDALGQLMADNPACGSEIITWSSDDVPVLATS